MWFIPSVDGFWCTQLIKNFHVKLELVWSHFIKPEFCSRMGIMLDIKKNMITDDLEVAEYPSVPKSEIFVRTAMS